MGACVSSFFALLTISKVGPVGPTAMLLFIGPLGGPFAEPFAYTDLSIVRMIGCGTVLGGFILLHPLRPNRLTALITAAAIGWWFLYGLALTYYGV